MSITSRELVLRTLNFENPPRAPQELWVLPIAALEHPGEAKAIQAEFVSDFQGIGGHLRAEPATKGSRYEPGEYTDEWGCVFVNIQRGVIGEVRDPLVRDWAADSQKVHIPSELLAINSDLINRDCGKTDKFTRAGCCPRPFERLQFIRGTAELFMDLLDPSPAFLEFIRRLHRFHVDLIGAWAKTDVDSIMFMDDWGSQRALLISPSTWREYFKPMYRDFIQIIHGAGKKAFMHSDGDISAIYPDLVELGLDAVNSQIFCMGVRKLKPFAGKITFWGEMDRQHLLPSGTVGEIDAAVKEVHRHLWKNGGCIAQCEFGPAARPENVRQVFKSWREAIRA